MIVIRPLRLIPVLKSPLLRFFPNPNYNNITLLRSSSLGLTVIKGKAASSSSFRSMSVSVNSSSVVEKAVVDNGPQQVALLTAINDDHDGIIVELKEHMNYQDFSSSLKASLSHWRQQGKKGIWIKLPIELSNLVEAAVKEGFWYHHAEPTYLMLVYWIPKTVNTIPINASHRVGIGAFVMNDKREIPAKVAAILERKMARFLWGSTDAKKKIHLLNWDLVCQPKDRGGLGLQRIRTLNRSLLVKWHWRWVSEEGDALWKSVIEQKFGRDESGWGNLRSFRSNGLSKWNMILKFKDDFFKNSRVRIRDGRKASFWDHNWALTRPLSIECPALHLASQRKDGRVADFVHLAQENQGWFIPLRRSRPRPLEVQEFEKLVTTVPIPPLLEGPDEVLWIHQGKIQEFTVKAQSRFFQEEVAHENNLVAWDLPVKLVWNNLVPPKVCFLLWTCCIGRLSTSSRLRRLGMMVETECPFCNQGEETQSHLLLNCRFSIQIWNTFRRLFASTGWVTASCLEALQSWKKGPTNTMGNLMWDCLPHAVIWSLWLERNSRKFEQKAHSPNWVVMGAKKLMWQWLGRRPELSGILYHQFLFEWESILYVN